MIRTRLMPLAALIVPAGCSQTPFEHIYAPVDPDFGTGGEASISAGRGSVAVSGKFDVSCGSHTIEAALEHNAGTLEVTITRKPESDDACRTAAGRYSYTGAITGLPRGTYLMRVRHVGEADLANGIYKAQSGVQVD